MAPAYFDASVDASQDDGGLKWLIVLATLVLFACCFFCSSGPAEGKDGFKPLNTDEGDGMLDEDSESEVGIITLLAPYKSAAMILIIIMKPQKSHTLKLQYKPLLSF